MEINPKNTCIVCLEPEGFDEHLEGIIDNEEELFWYIVGVAKEELEEVIDYVVVSDKHGEIMEKVDKSSWNEKYAEVWESMVREAGIEFVRLPFCNPLSIYSTSV